MSRIVLRDLTKTFGDLAILDPLSLAIESGSFVSVIGPSGCGKTTLVRVIAGLDRFLQPPAPAQALGMATSAEAYA